jgi:predicted dehydrogenase
VEKPVALEEKSIAALGDLAARAGRWVVPAFCMRHWPGWAWLHQRIRAGTFGPALGGSFLRTGARPDWSEVYADDRRSGGALFDIHIHDVDFIRWCWGTPRTVSSTGSIRHLATHYRMTGGPGVLVAEGGWLSQPGTPFRMRYTVEFADAVVDFDLGRDPTVLLTRGTITEPVRFPPGSAYDLQARHFLDLILDRTDQPVATLDDALLVTAILRAERASIDQGKPVPVAVAGRRVEP